MSKYFGGVSPVRQTERAKIVVLVCVFSILLFGSLAFVFLYSNPDKGAAGRVVIDRTADVEMVDLLVPVQKIEPGTLLSPTMFRRESRPRVGLGERSVTSYEQIKNMYARSLIMAGHPLYEDFITNVRPQNVVTGEIKEGYRAITIKVDATSSVEGWATPGARVDVNWVGKIVGVGQSIATIVQNAKVLSAERQVNNAEVKPGAPVPNTVTLLVTAKDAQKVQLAQTSGILSLSLRGDSDTGKADAGGAMNLIDIVGPGRSDQVPQNSGIKIRIKEKDGTYVDREWVGDKLVPATGGRR